ncbi:antitoxin VapB family protein [Methanoplanus endosymbiosus]|uniref:Antitoxin VapB family protein n=1 Tax=Methanoplanus endosymbiosus TaxID=33865 RepID=A0A9E7THV5_9EURY|nr:antitoxin VapB family protein [Methanoplanus endosymbiosus]UUX93687.1 antitoxin VapB family protein [Methanoplanus endosymbiosus]
MSKTVSLSDEAYERLKKWKNNDDESFSSVVLRTIPSVATPEELHEAISKIGRLSDEDADIMTKSVEED